MKIALPLMGKFLSIIVSFSTITLLVTCPNANSGFSNSSYGDPSQTEIVAGGVVSHAVLGEAHGVSTYR